MKKVNFFKRLFLHVSFPYVCRLRDDQNPAFRGARFAAREGDELQIVHLPSAETPHAVFVYSVPLNRVLGQLSKRSAETLVKLFGKNFCADGELHARKEKDGDFHVELLVFNRLSLMKDADFDSLHE